MKFKIFALLNIIIFIAPLVFADKTAGTSAMTFLKISQGARPSGMGGVFTAISDDPLALYWNPAGLSFQRVPELSAQFFSYIEDTSIQNIVFAMPIYTQKPVTLAGGVIVLQSKGFKKTITAGNTYGFEEKGEFNAMDLSGSVGAGMAMTPQASVGLSVKFMQETLDDEKATAAAFDIGLLLQSIDRPYRLGLVVQNIGTQVKFKEKSFALPRVFKFALAREIFSSGWISMEGIQASDTDLEFRIGLEVPLANLLFIRGGYQYLFNKKEMGDYTDFTAGIGFNFQHFGLDYAVASYGDFGYTHRVSMNFKFGKAEPLYRPKRYRRKKVIYIE